MTAPTALIVDSNSLAQAIADTSQTLTILDVRPISERETGYVPGSQHLDPSRLNRSEGRVNGLLPKASEVANWANEFGFTADSWIVVYDGGRATAAARALWVLHVYGFNNVLWLDGGVPIWRQSSHPVVTDDSTSGNFTGGNRKTNAGRNTNSAPISAETLRTDPDLVWSKHTLLARFSQTEDAKPVPQAIDARSAAEFAGTDVRSARGGHMPGAVHFEWLDLFQDDGRLKPDAQLRDALAQRSIEASKPCVVYCQSHQRSSVTYLVLKHLGFSEVAALDGAWSNWGNDPDTPIER